MKNQIPGNPIYTADIAKAFSKEKTIEIKKGTGFIQGIFMEFGICEDDETDALRDGGFGSTTGKGK